MNRSKPIIPRAIAQDDVDEAVEYYLGENAPEAALGFIDALERAYTEISRTPSTGSTRYAHELDIPGLRFRSLKNYPYLVFYVEHENYIDAWRVLHGNRDIAKWMQDEST